MKKIGANDCDAAFALNIFLNKSIVNISLQICFISYNSSVIKLCWKWVSRSTRIWLRNIEALKF